ncbi:MAG: apolipoprotein N-acyltransferase [Actinomycetota bacterium]|jgi:apolipoprotein N-acyltransferase
MRRVAAGLALSGLSAVLATLSFGPFNVWWLVFVAFVPMVIAQHAVLPERWSGAAYAVGIGGFVTGYMAGLLDPTFAWWMRAIPVLIVGPLWFAGVADRRFHQRTNYRYLIIATPLAWAAVDFLRGSVPMIATRASLPYALFDHPSLIQPVSITGLVGLNLLILVTNWTVAAFFIQSVRVTRRHVVAVVGAAAVWFTASVALLENPTPTVRVAAIQPGVRSADANEYNRNVAQTREAAAAGARLIVWREMTLPFDPARNKTEELRALAREANAFLVIGYAVETRDRLRNEAVVIAPDGSFLGTYSKQHPALMFAGDAKATSGNSFPVYDTPIGRLATIICFDLDFTDTSRGMARHGAQLVAVPSLDPPGDATKHHPLLVFRAVENRVTMVKAESKFASAILDPYGRIVRSAISRSGSQATVIADVPLGSGRSVFVTMGDAFAWLVVAAAATLYVWALRRSRVRSGASGEPRDGEAHEELSDERRDGDQLLVGLVHVEMAEVVDRVR